VRIGFWKRGLPSAARGVIQSPLASMRIAASV
jgi:hypothetical protein